MQDIRGKHKNVISLAFCDLSQFYKPISMFIVSAWLKTVVKDSYKLLKKLKGGLFRDGVDGCQCRWHKLLFPQPMDFLV
jgi:hypothetical protein